MSGRPLRISICGMPFKVEWVESLVPPGVGRCEVHEQTILVQNQGQGPDQERDTVLHEILHAAIKMTGHEDDFRSSREEAVVYGISPVLLGVLRGNPHLVDWLTEELP